MLTPMSMASTATHPAGGGDEGQKNHHCGQVVDEVRQQSSDGGDGQQAEQGLAGGDEMVDKVPQPVADDGLDDDSQTQNG